MRAYLSAAVLAATTMLLPAGSATAEEIVVGEMAPEFTVTAEDGGEASLADWQGQPVVLVFSRAHWCPYCMRHIGTLAESYEQFQDLGAEVVVVYREEEDGAEGLAASREATGATFPFLLDLGAEATPDYSPEGYDAYVLDSEGVVQAVVDGTKAERPTAAELLAAIEQLNEVPEGAEAVPSEE